MRALDTCVLARFFVDDPDDAQAVRQRPAAIAALSQRCWVSVTVLLELEWVLRGFYGLPVGEVSRVLRALASVPHVTLEDRDAAIAAIEALDQGLDFADALHMTRSTRATGFATFDRRLAQRAGRLELPTPVELLSPGR
jgi:predicted nucleic-acid-binding protein